LNNALREELCREHIIASTVTIGIKGLESLITTLS
jgi:hypothetical protein